jgi:hypothetical protein
VNEIRQSLNTTWMSRRNSLNPNSRIKLPPFSVDEYDGFNCQRGQRRVLSPERSRRTAGFPGIPKPKQRTNSTSDDHLERARKLQGGDDGGKRHRPKSLPKSEFHVFNNNQSFPRNDEIRKGNGQVHPQELLLHSTRQRRGSFTRREGRRLSPERKHSMKGNSPPIDLASGDGDSNSEEINNASRTSSPGDTVLELFTNDVSPAKKRTSPEQVPCDISNSNTHPTRFQGNMKGDENVGGGAAVRTPPSCSMTSPRIGGLGVKAFKTRKQTRQGIQTYASRERKIPTLKAEAWKNNPMDEYPDDSETNSNRAAESIERAIEMARRSDIESGSNDGDDDDDWKRTSKSTPMDEIRTPLMRRNAESCGLPLGRFSNSESPMRCQAKKSLNDVIDLDGTKPSNVQAGNGFSKARTNMNLPRPNGKYFGVKIVKIVQSSRFHPGAHPRIINVYL